MNSDPDLYAFLALWLAAPILLFSLYAARGKLGGFLVYSYLMGLVMNHWFGALVHASPWSPFLDSSDTLIGFRYSTYGLLAFVLGTLVINVTRPPSTRLPRAQESRRTQLVNLGELERLVRVFFLPLGIGAWIATYTPLAALPSAGAVLSVGKTGLLLAICLMCWSAWHKGNTRQFYQWIGISLVLPVITIITSGFIGYGIAMITTILAFVAMFYRPRWHLLALLSLMLYGGVSLWVGYAEHRGNIRDAVWGGQDYGQRADAMLSMIYALTPFDISNPRHLELVDIRLNQNVLVGAVMRSTPSLVPFRDGSTIVDGLLAVIPRALWPGKPEVGGSGNYVSDHSMIAFSAGTSIGMGQVIEFYINFGLPGIIVGFFIFGMALRYMDVRLAEAMTAGDWYGVMFFFFVGSGTLQTGGSLAEIGASMAAGVAIYFIGIEALRFLKHYKAVDAPLRKPN